MVASSCFVPMALSQASSCCRIVACAWVRSFVRLLFSAGAFEQANVDMASPMQPIEIVMRRATFPRVGAMSPFLSTPTVRTSADRAACGFSIELQSLFLTGPARGKLRHVVMGPDGGPFHPGVSQVTVGNRARLDQQENASLRHDDEVTAGGGARTVLSSRWVIDRESGSSSPSSVFSGRFGFKPDRGKSVLCSPADRPWGAPPGKVTDGPTQATCPSSSGAWTGDQLGELDPTMMTRLDGALRAALDL